MKCYSTSKIINISFNKWMEYNKDNSFVFKKYGSFLNEQNELFKEIYNQFTLFDKKINVYKAPPASGKTHVICLLASYLEKANYDVNILVPNQLLIKDIENEKTNVKNPINAKAIDLKKYSQIDTNTDFVILDDAHNLKSFFEMDSENVKIFEIDSDSEIYDYASNGVLNSDTPFASKQVSHTFAKDLMDYLILDEYEEIKEIQKNASEWNTFVYAWKSPDFVKIKFVKNKFDYSISLPKYRLMMFSATPLSDNELNFYCGFHKRDISRANEVDSSSDWKTQQRSFFSIINRLNNTEKIDILESILSEIDDKVLVLFNTHHMCKEVFYAIHERLKNPILTPDNISELIDAYNAFYETDNAILFSSSPIFWEGITIKSLSIVIIFDMPFPEPHIFDLMTSKPFDPSLDIKRKLEQGLGRISRRKGDYAIGLTLFDLISLNYDIPHVVQESSYERLNSWKIPLIVHKIFKDKNPTLEDYCTNSNS